MEIDFSPLQLAARRASEWQSGFDPRPGLLAREKEKPVVWSVQSGAGWLRQEVQTAADNDSTIEVGVSGPGLYETLQAVHGMEMVSLHCDGMQFDLNPGTEYEDSTPLTGQWSTADQADVMDVKPGKPLWAIKLLSSDMAHLLTLGRWAAAGDAEDAALAQVEFHIDSDVAVMVAGNGIKLATATATVLQPAKGKQLLVLPTAMAAAWLSIVSLMPDDSAISITRHENLLSVHFGSTEVVLFCPVGKDIKTGLFSLLGDLDTRQDMAMAQMASLDRKRVRAVCSVSQAVLLSTTETGMALTTQHRETLGRHRSAELDVGGSAHPGEIAVDGPALHAALQLIDGAVKFSICSTQHNRILLIQSVAETSIQPRIGLVALNV